MRSQSTDKALIWASFKTYQTSFTEAKDVFSGFIKAFTMKILGP